MLLIMNGKEKCKKVWRELDEGYVEVYEEDPIEDPVDEEVDVDNVTPRPDIDKLPKSLATYDVTYRVA